MKHPILSCKCPEPDGTVIRHVYPAEISLELINTLWQKTRPFSTILNKELRDDFDSFSQIFYTEVNGQLITDSLFWIIDDFVGMFYLTDIKDTEALAHFTFWDRRFKGRLELTSKMIQYIFDKYQLQRINVEVPAYARPATKRFINMLGFLPEGRKRRAAKFNNLWFDVNMYGLLRSELVHVTD